MTQTLEQLPKKKMVTISFVCKGSGVSLDDKHSFTELPPRCPEHQFNFTLLQEKFSKSECLKMFKKLDKCTIVLISDWMKTKI